MNFNRSQGPGKDDSWRVPELENWRDASCAQADEDLMDFLGPEVDEAVNPVLPEQDIRFLIEQDGRTVRVDLALLLSQSDTQGVVQPLPQPAPRVYPLGAPKRSEPLGIEELGPR